MAVIPFEGANLISIYNEETGDKYVALKPIVEAIGLQWKSQWKKLKRLEEEGISIWRHPVKTNGGLQEMIFIRVEDLPAYLYSINVSKVKKELREKLLKFKRETTKVINDYWNKGAVVNPRVNPKNLKEIISQAISEYEKQRTELVATEIEKIKIQKAEVARRYITTLKELPNIDERYLESLGRFGVSLLTGEPIEGKRQITVDEFLKSKKIYDKGARSSFGRFLAKFYKEKRGYKPKKSLSIVNGKETLTNYYTSEDLPLIEEAFKEWRRLKRMLSG